MKRTFIALASFAALACVDSPQEDAATMGSDQDPAAASGAGDVAFVADPFLMEAEQLMSELERDVVALGEEYADVEGPSATEWDATQRLIMEAQRTVEEDLARAMQGTGEVPQPVREEIASGIETLTVAVERARLVAADDPATFVETSKTQLVELDGNLETLDTRSAAVTDTQERTAITSQIDVMTAEVETLSERVDAIQDAPPDQIAQERDEISRAIAMLSGSVRRAWLELPAGSTLQ